MSACYNRFMKKLLGLWLFLLLVFGVDGARAAEEATSSVMLLVNESVTATVAGVTTATPAAEATMAAVVEEQPKPKDDLTQPKEAKSRLERVLDSKIVDSLKVTNFMQVAIREAVSRGVPVNTIVLMIMFPLVAVIIAAARHIVGMQGFGIFTPAVISVAFLATGVTVGMLLFIGILAMATVSRWVMRSLKLPSLPRMALLIWFVSMGVLGLLLASPWLKLEGLVKINIFPILLLVLLVETFMEVQITTTFKTALWMTGQTFLLALVSFLVMSTQSLQEWVLLNPEIAVVGIVVLDLLMGRYDGLRLLERWRFRKLLVK